MTLILLILLTLSACFFVFIRRHCIGALLYTFTILLFLAFSCGPIPAWLLNNLQSPYLVKPTIKWGERNAIILLGAGTLKIPQESLVEPGMPAYARLLETATLYRKCKKEQRHCKVIVSGGDPQHHGISEAHLYKEVLTQIGISPIDIVPEDKSMNTWQNAQFTRDKLINDKPDRIVLVTTGTHLRRSMLYFSHFGIKAFPVRADYIPAILSPLPLAYNIAVADLSLHEYLGIMRYYLYKRLHWNPEQKLPGKP